jgi:predicted phage gp36 major capsid-like protein
MQGIAVAQLASGKAAVGAAIAGKASSKINSIAQIATVGVTSAAQIAAILSAGKGSKSSGGAAAGGSAEGASSPPPSLPTVTGASAPQIQTTGGMNATQQIGETISASQRPIKAYVVSGDITSQQALDRRTSRAATFSAG